MTVWRYLLRGLLQAVPTVLGISLVAFWLVRASGDPAAILLPLGSPDDVVVAFRAEHGLDRPLPVQFLRFVQHAFTGDLGDSIRYRVPVIELLGERLPATLQLTFGGMLIATVVGVPLGVIGAVRRDGLIDTIGRLLTLTLQAIPVFYFSILLVLVFGVWLDLLPTFGRGGLDQLILPSVSLAAFLLPLIVRSTRGAVLDVLQQEYVQTARAKGLSSRRVFGLHVTKNAALPIITILGLQLGASMSGAIITEAVFAWPGVGSLLINSISTRDFPVIQGIVVFSAFAFVAINLIVDVLYKSVDPRITLS